MLLAMPLLVPAMSMALPSPGHQATSPDGGGVQTGGNGVAFVNTATTLFGPSGLIKSTLLSPFTSAAVTELGLPPALKLVASTNPPLPLFVNTDSEFAL